MFRRILLIHIFIFSLSFAHAQPSNNLSLSIDMGVPLGKESKNLGLLFQVEPKLKVSDRLFLGMRIAAAINSQKIEFQDSTQFLMNEEHDHGFFSVIPTVDYYWSKKQLHPFIGLGLGPYSLANSFDVFETRTGRTLEINQGYRIGGLIRGGLEYRRTRFSLEYNFVPKAPLLLADGENIGSVNSSYFGLLVGYLLINKKSKNRVSL